MTQRVRKGGVLACRGVGGRGRSRAALVEEFAGHGGLAAASSLEVVAGGWGRQRAVRNDEMGVCACVSVRV